MPQQAGGDLISAAIPDGERAARGCAGLPWLRTRFAAASVSLGAFLEFAVQSVGGKLLEGFFWR